MIDRLVDTTNIVLNANSPTAEDKPDSRPFRFGSQLSALSFVDDMWDRVESVEFTELHFIVNIFRRIP